MTSYTTTCCEKCGRELNFGDFPFCPHGRGQNGRQTNESFIGGVTIENLGDQPVTVYSREEFQRAMIAANVEQRIKHVPGDKHLINWAAGIDAQTLANAAVLLTRGHETAEAPLLPSLRTEIRSLDHKGDVVHVTRRDG